jgi:hypothetical protein
MGKLAMITMILLFVGIVLAYSSCNVSGEVGKPAYFGNGHDLTNNTDSRNYSCSNNTGRPANHKCRTNETDTCVGPNIENCTRACKYQNETTCSPNNYTFNNCACPELGANNSSGISCARNGPCPVNGTINQITLNKEKKNGRVFTMTMNCPRCT